MTDLKKYSRYLTTTTLKGRLYKKFILYPRITSNLFHPSLDVGCGLGGMLLFNREMIGVDVNEHNVQHCRALGLNVVLMNFDELPFADKSFKSLLLDNVMEHISSPIKLLSETHRLLMNDGNVVFGIPGNMGYTQDEDHKINYSDDDFVALIESFGFKFSHKFYSPFKSDYLNDKAGFYCRYFNFIKS